MNKEQFEAIKDAIYIIDKDIKRELDLDSISKKVGISKYHLHRLFKSITGKPLMSYVRGRRLSLSIKELLGTDLKIIDISNEYHFEHEQSYIRAFKQMFHITPAQYRKQKQELPIEQRVDTNFLSSIGQGILVQPRMCLKPGFFIKGLRSQIVHEKNLVDMDTNRQAELFEKEYLPYIDNAVDKNVYIGYTSYTDNHSYSNFYTSSIEVEGTEKTEPLLTVHKIPTNEYAVFRYIGLHSPYEVTFATLRDLYLYIGQWKLDTSYVQSNPYHFERMDLKVCGKKYCEMDIYVPIKAI